MACQGTSGYHLAKFHLPLKTYLAHLDRPLLRIRWGCLPMIFFVVPICEMVYDLMKSSNSSNKPIEEVELWQQENWRNS
jgi:hypothetical protein